MRRNLPKLDRVSAPFPCLRHLLTRSNLSNMFVISSANIENAIKCLPNHSIGK